MIEQHKGMGSILFLVSICAVMFLSSCGGSSGSKVVQSSSSLPGAPPTETASSERLQPALNTINSRIHSYETRLNEIKATENSPNSIMIPRDKMAALGDCKSQILDILTDYDSLQKKILQEPNPEEALNLANAALPQVNQQDMQFLEGGCVRLQADIAAAPQASPGVPPAASQTPLPPPDPQVQQAFNAGDYSKVITLYNQLGASSSLTPAYETTYEYGQALLKNYQHDEAARVFSGLQNSMGQSGDPALRIEVQRMLGDIYFSAAQYVDAQQRYEDAVQAGGDSNAATWSTRQLAAFREQTASPNELQAYSALLRNYLAYVPSRDGYAISEQAEQFLGSYPASRFVANVNLIHQDSRAQADAWLNRGIERVEQRVEGHTGEAAAPGTDQGTPANTNTTVPDTASTPAPGAVPDTAGGQASSSNQLTQEQQAAREQALFEQYNQGTSYLAAKEYDKALAVFTSLSGSSYEGKAREKINETIQLAAEENRQKAAELYVRASGMKDIDSKKKMLLASRQLLQDILVKYPQAGLNSKVERNLTSVEQTIREIDPSFSGTTPSGPGQQL